MKISSSIRLRPQVLLIVEVEAHGVELAHGVEHGVELERELALLSKDQSNKRSLCPSFSTSD